MSALDTALGLLRKKRLRFTQARRMILSILDRESGPLSAPEILSHLAHQNVFANKTTVYREMQLLKEERIVRELDFGDRRKRYEIMPPEHHHHLVCTRCGTIDHVPLEDDVTSLESTITALTRFQVLDHMLEFFGLCERCQIQGQSAGSL